MSQLTLDRADARILVADPIAEDGVERLRSAGTVDVRTGLSGAELVAIIGAYDALVVRSETRVSAEVLDAARRLRVVGRAGVGVDNIDIDAATRHGVMVLNAPTGNTIAAAEHAVALMCALVRNVAAADASLKGGRWDRNAFMGSELREKTLGLLGLGKIGSEVARAASLGLLMRVIAHDPMVAPERAEQAGAELVDFDTLLREADVLSVHVPLTDTTRGCIGAAELAAMRPGARVINVARGGIIDEAALAAALASGHLAGAAVDVFTTEPVPAGNPLLAAPNTLLTPHLGASTLEAQVNVAYDVADQIAAVLAGGVARYAVNAPAILPEELAALRPYMELAERMGALARQLVGGRLRRVSCTYSGELAAGETIVLTAEALRGILAPYTETRINPINARAVARQRGIALEERSATATHDFANTMVLEVTGAERITLAGTQFEGQARITRIDEYRVTMAPHGRYLVATNQDRRGVIAAVSTLLAECGINIAGIELSRDQPYGRALMLLETDEEVGEAVLERLRGLGVLETLRAVAL
ncbi:MAG TPA: phosphoglycerate dehydrogenase [Candidatus Dormibacteraeota bacterium]